MGKETASSSLVSSFLPHLLIGRTVRCFLYGTSHTRRYAVRATIDVKNNLRYLPLFYDELEEKVVYIAEKLQNPQAANDLLDAVEKAILERLPDAEAVEPYHPMAERTYSYYRIYVKSFVIYYVVIDDELSNKTMEVRRLLYNRQNRDAKI